MVMRFVMPMTPGRDVTAVIQLKKFGLK
jgi:hypothetical protein